MLGGNDDKCCLALPQNQPPEFDLCSMGPHYKTYISLQDSGGVHDPVKQADVLGWAALGLGCHKSVTAIHSQKSFSVASSVGSL